jgi:CheY-like chemotaxis protein
MRPDIILSDIIMPEKNGCEVCEYVAGVEKLRESPEAARCGGSNEFAVIYTELAKSCNADQRGRKRVREPHAGQEKSCRNDSLPLRCSSLHYPHPSLQPLAVMTVINQRDR